MLDRTPYETWLNNWETEADRLFEELKRVPPELEPEARKLMAWRAEARTLSAELQDLRNQLWAKRMARRETEARIDEIVKRQARQIEQELERQKIEAWRAKVERMKREIDRVTTKIILEMQYRHRLRIQQQQEADRAAQEQAAADLAIWEAFKHDLLRNMHSEEIAAQELAIEQAHRAEEQARRAAEYEAYQERPTPSEDENEAAWREFLDEFGSDQERG